MLGTKSSNSVSIQKHFLAIHGVDIDRLLSNHKEKNTNKIIQFLEKPKFNSIWTFESAISQLICVDLLTLNQIKSSLTIKELMKKEFNVEIKSFYQIRNILKVHLRIIIEIITKEIQSYLKLKQKVSISFDEWMSGTNTQMVNIIVHTNDTDFNLGLVAMKKSCNAENLLSSISSRLSIFGIDLSNISYWIADGAAVNKKISRISEIPMLRCINHAIQLAIVDIFYKPMPIESDSCTDSENELEDSIEDIDSDKDDFMVIEDGNEEQFNPQDYLPSNATIDSDLHPDFMNAIKKVRQIVIRFRRPAAKRVLSKYTNKTLLLDVKTRWVIFAYHA